MKALPILNERIAQHDGAFAELCIWQVPRPVPGSKHPYKYRLAFVVNGECVLRYDNETSKGDHKHIGEQEMPYDFLGPERLLADFWQDVDQWR